MAGERTLRGFQLVLRTAASIGTLQKIVLGGHALSFSIVCIDFIGRDPVQPTRKRAAPPSEPFDVPQRLKEGLGR